MKIFYLSHTLYTEGQDEVTKIKELAGVNPIFSLNDPAIDIQMHLWYGKNPEEEEDKLLKIAKDSLPDMFLYQSTWKDVSEKFFQKIRQLNIKIVTIFADTLSITPSSEIRLIRHSDYVIVYDSLTNYFRYRFLYEALRSQAIGGVSFAGGHQFPTESFKNLEIFHDYDVSMIGSVEGIRGEMIAFLNRELTKRNINFHATGGIINFNPNKPKDALSDDFLPIEKYIEIINRSKINIISQTRPERSQIKCKIFEYMACGAFCLIDKNIEYQLLAPDSTLVYYTSLEDCLEKIIYYYNHDSERQAIAQRGYEWFRSTFDYKKFWQQTFTAMNKGSELPILPQVANIYEILSKKLNFTDAIYAELRRLIFVSLDYTSHTIKMPINIMVSSSINSSSHLQDPLSNGFWHSEAGWPQWIVLDYGKCEHFNVVHINNVLINDGIHLKEFSIEATNDLQEWTSLFLGKMKNIEILQIFNFENKKKFRFYRITGYSNYHGTQNMLLSEVKFLSKASILPKLSVVIFANNNLTDLSRSLDNINQQAYSNAEIIIMDNEKIPDLPNLIENQAGDTVKTNKINSDSIYESYTKALNFASGDFVIFVRSGDTLASNCLNQIAIAFETKKDLQIISCGVSIQNSTMHGAKSFTKITEPSEIGCSLSNSVLGFSFLNSNFIKKSILDTMLPLITDSKFWQHELMALIALKKFSSTIITEPLYHVYLSNEYTNAAFEEDSELILNNQSKKHLFKKILNHKFLKLSDRLALYNVFFISQFIEIYAFFKNKSSQDVFKKLNRKLDLSSGFLNLLKQLTNIIFKKIKSRFHRNR